MSSKQSSKHHRRPAWLPATVPPGYPAWLAREGTLLDGRVVRVRPVVPEDAVDLRRAMDRADPETVRLRFLGGRPPRTDAEFAHLVTLDYERRLAIAAFSDDGQGVGIARYESVSDTDTAEVAVVVDPAWRHVGLAGLLLQLLGEAAVRQGIHRFTAEFFADNVDVTDLLAESGAAYQRSRAGPGVSVATVILPEDSADPA